MDKYTVVWADDEEEMIQTIIRKIDWDSLGFSMLGYADNGVKALELVEELQPDVVITDIRMPYMDGMELAKHIKTEYPATKLLIFTGFDQFEYAKEAIHLDVEEYILKPVNLAELVKVFTQLKIKLDQEISEKKNGKLLQEYYRESLPLLQVNFCSTLIEGRMDENEIQKYLSDYQMNLTGPYFCCVVIYTSKSYIPQDMTPMLLSTFVEKQAQERLGEKLNARSFPYLGNTILIAQLEQKNDIVDLTDECDRFCRYVHRLVGAVISVGIGQVCDNLMELEKSYVSAREAVSYRAIYGASRAINISEIAPKQASRGDSTKAAALSNLFKMIHLNSEENIEEAVDAYLKYISLPEKSMQQHHVDIMELVSALYTFCTNNDISPGASLKDVKTLYTSLLEREPNALRKWLVDISLLFHDELSSARNNSTRSFVMRAKEYVKENYSDEELSLDTICDVLNLSNSYFSTIFKRDTGESFISYLTNFRMDYAARQLIETNEKSYMIAKNVGYLDPNYFSYVFKRRFGVSPSKYRTEHTQSEE